MHGAYDYKWNASSSGQEIDDHLPLEQLVSRLQNSKLPRTLRFATENIQPWVKWSFDEDFILLAEFSEDEGPRPVMTIPKDGSGMFDLNHFSVHVMSVDYQSQGRGSPFCIVEDTQLFITERKEKVYAYVHHFTLYDIHARGFVRPFCMCYISHSKRKVLSCLGRLMEEFNKVSRMFRLGNRVIFIQDLEQRLIDLYTLKDEKLSSWCRRRNEKEEESEKQRKLKKHYEQILMETRKIIEILKPHMNDSRIISQFKQLESLADRRQRSATCSTCTSEGARTQCPGNSCALQRAESLPNLGDLDKNRKKQKHHKFAPAYLHNLKQLRNLHELCEWGAKEGLNRLRYIYKHFSQDEVAVTIETTEATLIDPLPSLLTIGRSVVHNFLHEVNLNCIAKQVFNKPCDEYYSPVCPRRNPSHGSLYSLDSFHSCVEEDIIGSARSSDGDLSPFTAASTFHVDLHAGEESDVEQESTSSIPESETQTSDGGGDDSMSLDEFDIIDEKSEYVIAVDDPNFSRQTSENTAGSSFSLRTNALLKRKSHSMDNLTAVLHSEPRDIHSEPRNIHSERRVHQHRQSGALKPFLLRAGSEVSNHKSSHGKMDRCHYGWSKEYHKKRWRGEEYNKRPQSSSQQDITSLGTTKKRHNSIVRNEKVCLRCYAEEACKADEKSIGGDIVQFRNDYSFGVHLVAALLCGRPVAILADPQNEKCVRVLISTLWMFVPENMTHYRTVVPWRKKPLQISDLSWLKLIGLARNKHCNMIPKAVKHYVSVLDYETGNIITPPYKGVFLGSVFNLRNNWPTNASLMAFIHSVFLELASKAYVYYYTFCLRSLRWCACKGGVSAAVTVQTRSSADTSDVLSRLGVHFSDAKIIQYLAELIKHQQLNHHLLSLQQDQEYSAVDETLLPDASLPIEAEIKNARPTTITADLSKCSIFKNLKPLDN